MSKMNWERVKMESRVKKFTYPSPGRMRKHRVDFHLRRRHKENPSGNDRVMICRFCGETRGLPSKPRVKRPAVKPAVTKGRTRRRILTPEELERLRATGDYRS